MSTAASNTAAPPERPKKLQRISQACDLCHRRSIRCRPSAEEPGRKCQNCYDFGVDCKFERPSRRRRNNPQQGNQSPPSVVPQQPPPPRPPIPPISNSQPTKPPSSVSTADYSGPEAVPNGTSEQQYNNASDYTGAFKAVREGRSEDGLAIAWRSFALASLETIEQLLGIYMEVVYPIYPLFHGPTLWERIRRRDHLFDRGFFASVMGACALASARARDGALNEFTNFSVHGPERQSEIFFSAASDAMFKDLNKAQGLGFLRACGLLALTAIQYGQIASMHQYHGHFCSLSAMQQFHDESHWPQDLSLVEIEERRRLYWSMYSLDVLSTVVFNGVLKFQETSARVRYPTEVDDEDLTATSCSPRPNVHWLHGWNFTTTLFRVLEHTIQRTRRNQDGQSDRLSITSFILSDDITKDQILNNVASLYHALPVQCQSYNVPFTGNRTSDLFGFQAANIQATYQLLRMTLLSVDQTHDVDYRCGVANDLLRTFHSICPRFLQAISTPLVYQLGGIGHILASVMEGLLTEKSYMKVRESLVSMANLLEMLESGLQPTAGASRGLRTQIDRIDQYMQAQRRMVPNMLEPQTSPVALAAARRQPFTQMGVPLNDGYHHHTTQPLNEFQLPPDLVSEWPWPFDLNQPGNSNFFAQTHGFDE